MRNPRGGRKKQEIVTENIVEEEEDEEITRKRKVIGCINPQEAAEFQEFVKDRMEELVEEMRREKNLVNPVRKLIRALKLKYDKIHLFENNGVANTEDIMNTICDTKGIAWRKSIEGREIMDAEDYNKIIKMCMESRLFQEGHLNLKLDNTVFGEETDELKEKIMEKCASLFHNVEKAHQVNLAVAKDLKDLANMIKEPEVFSKIAQAATQPLVACYTPWIDIIIKQCQVTIDAKQDKLAQHKTIEELMDMSNLPQYNTTWGDKDNKDRALTRYMAGIIWFFMKHEMSGTAPNIGNIADTFKVSRSQLSRLITAKKFKSGPGGFVPKKKRAVVEGKTSGAAAKMELQD